MAMGFTGHQGPYFKSEMANCFVALGKLDKARALAGEFEHLPEDNRRRLEYNIAMASARNEFIEVQRLIEIYAIENAPALTAEHYLDLEMWEKAAEWIEKSYQEGDHALVYWSLITLPEHYGNHPALQKAFDKPELNALFEIRRKNLGLTNHSP